MNSTTQGSSPVKKNKKSALDVRRKRGMKKAKAGNIPGNNNNQSINAARALRGAEEPWGSNPRKPPKSLNEGVLPSIERMGGTPNARTPPNLFPTVKSTRTAA